MKTTTVVVQILLGLLLLFASISYFLKLFPAPELEGNMKVFQEGLIASSYLLPLVKLVELFCGLCFVSGRFVILANLVIFPITINIVCINFFLTPEGIPVALFLLLANLFLIYTRRGGYKALFCVQ